jgi:peptidoglycan/LPS O-acetylase OafA/YrhL
LSDVSIAILLRMQTVSPNTGQNQRRYDIDWLRITAMLTVFLYHNARFFDVFGWHLKNAEKSFVVTLFIVLLTLWVMPLFFLLSGVGSWYALKSRATGQYLLDRVRRLLIPLYTVGALSSSRPNGIGIESPTKALVAPFGSHTCSISPKPLVLAQALISALSGQATSGSLSFSLSFPCWSCRCFSILKRIQAVV